MNTKRISDSNEGMQRGARKQPTLKWKIRDERVVYWLNRADLAQISGKRGEFLELLERAGVATVPELAQHNAADLLARMGELNDTKRLVSTLPSEAQVGVWIEQAKTVDAANY